MQPFDEEYLSRRENQIQDQYMLGANMLACLITGAILVAVGVLMDSRLGTGLLVVGLLFVAGFVFMFATYAAQRAANRAIDREHERLMVLYGQMMDKPKRGESEYSVRVMDDGELPAEDSLESQIRRGTGVGG